MKGDGTHGQEFIIVMEITVAECLEHLIETFQDKTKRNQIFQTIKEAVNVTKQRLEHHCSPKDNVKEN